MRAMVLRVITHCLATVACGGRSLRPGAPEPPPAAEPPTADDLPAPGAAGPPSPRAAALVELGGDGGDGPSSYDLERARPLATAVRLRRELGR
jgi:hypothetical protein